MRIFLPMLLLASGFACTRPTSDYDVHIDGQGTHLDQIMPAPTPRSGRIEVVRFRLWGTNLGLGLTNLFGDSPRSDGLAFVTANAELAYPPDPTFDRSSAFVDPGPPLNGPDDNCFTQAYVADLAGVSEYADVGDHIALTAADGSTLRLDRDPAVYPDPAGESFYVGYGQTLRPAITGHDTLPDTWTPGAAWSISAPGGLPPATATVGAVPYPWAGGSITLPPAMTGLRVAGELVRPPHHDYDDAGVYSEGFEDDVRVKGPWASPVDITWTPSDPPAPVTLTLRLLGNVAEGACGCAVDCGAGFDCNADGLCESREGVTGRPLGELICTLHDDGAFTLTPEHVADLRRWVSDDDLAGAILLTSRVTEGVVDVPDMRTHNELRSPANGVRTRAIDAVVTRVEAP